MPWVINVKSREFAHIKKTDRIICRGDLLRIVHNEVIDVEGAVGQRFNKMTSLAGSGIKTDH